MSAPGSGAVTHDELDGSLLEAHRSTVTAWIGTAFEESRGVIDADCVRVPDGAFRAWRDGHGMSAQA